MNKMSEGLNPHTYLLFPALEPAASTQVLKEQGNTSAWDPQVSRAEMAEGQPAQQPQ